MRNRTCAVLLLVLLVIVVLGVGADPSANTPAETGRAVASAAVADHLATPLAALQSSDAVALAVLTAVALIVVVARRTSGIRPFPRRDRQGPHGLGVAWAAVAWRGPPRLV